VHGQNTFFIGFSFPLPNLPIVEGSKSVPRVLKLGFIQLDGIKMDEPGGAFVGAGSLWPEIMSRVYKIKRRRRLVARVKQSPIAK
jgi:hypothetical protein